MVLSQVVRRALRKGPSVPCFDSNDSNHQFCLPLTFFRLAMPHEASWNRLLAETEILLVSFKQRAQSLNHSLTAQETIITTLLSSHRTPLLHPAWEPFNNSLRNEQRLVQSQLSTLEQSIYSLQAFKTGSERNKRSILERTKKVDLDLKDFTLLVGELRKVYHRKVEDFIISTGGVEEERTEKGERGRGRSNSATSTVSGGRDHLQPLISGATTSSSSSSSFNLSRSPSTVNQSKSHPLESFIPKDWTTESNRVTNVLRTALGKGRIEAENLLSGAGGGIKGDRNGRGIKDVAMAKRLAENADREYRR